MIPAFQLGPLLLGKSHMGGRVLPLFVRDPGPRFVLAGRERTGRLVLGQDKHDTKFSRWVGYCNTESHARRGTRLLGPPPLLVTGFYLEQLELQYFCQQVTGNLLPRVQQRLGSPCDLHTRRRRHADNTADMKPSFFNVVHQLNSICILLMLRLPTLLFWNYPHSQDPLNFTSLC